MRRVPPRLRLALLGTCTRPDILPNTPGTNLGDGDAEGNTQRGNEAVAGGSGGHGDAEGQPGAPQATETLEGTEPEVETVDSGHGVQIPIVVTGSPWTEGEIAALIARAATPDVGGPYRAAAIFEQLTSRSRASAMGQWRKLVAEGRVQRSARSNRVYCPRGGRPTLRSAVGQAIQWLADNGHEDEEIYATLKSALG